MRIGLIIPIFNRHEYLSQVLSSLGKSTLPNSLELFLEDDGSTDDKTKSIASSFRLPNNKVSYTRYPNEGICKRLKTGFQKLQDRGFDIFINLDSDMIVKSYWLNILLEIYKEEPNALITGFNTPTHGIIGSLNKYDIKKSVGGANLLFDKKNYAHISRFLINNNWDSELSRHHSIKILASRPSVMQHIGIKSSMRHHSTDVADFW